MTSSLIVRIIAKLSVNTNALLDVIVLVFYIKKLSFFLGVDTKFQDIAEHEAINGSILSFLLSTKEMLL